MRSARRRARRKWRGQRLLRGSRARRSDQKVAHERAVTLIAAWLMPGAGAWTGGKTATVSASRSSARSRRTMKRIRRYLSLDTGSRGGSVEQGLDFAGEGPKLLGVCYAERSA